MVDWTTIISIISIVGTWVTILLVYFTLREMRNQRKAAQKPELIIPDVSVFGYAADREIFIASEWTNKENKSKEVVFKERTVGTIYNIGAGAAKAIKIEWDFDISNMVLTIQDYCYRNSVPVVVSIQNNGLKIEYKENHSWWNIEAYSNVKHPYLMPASVTAQGLESNLPRTYLQLISILIFLNLHQQREMDSFDRRFVPNQESPFAIPPLSCQLSYDDIGGDRYEKKFDVPFNITMVMGIPSKESQFSISQPIFFGMLEFREIK
jgi:hypothetical protein